MLQRQLDRAEGCYDDLVVVHDGPDDTDVRSLVESYGGRFFEQPRAFQQEPHWPFAWAQARHDWILRWDADEFPSDTLNDWLRAFRAAPEPPGGVAGYTCILPLWDGTRARTRRWPRRISLIHRQRVRYFGMAEQAPVTESEFVPLDLILHHQPHRKSYGFRYAVARPKVRRWYAEIARALLGKPTDLPCWRWESPEWPKRWEQIRQRPLRTAVWRFVVSPIGNAREMIECGEFPWPSFLVYFPLQHWMTCMSYFRIRGRMEKEQICERCARTLHDPRKCATGRCVAISIIAAPGTAAAACLSGEVPRDNL